MVLNRAKEFSLNQIYQSARICLKVMIIQIWIFRKYRWRFPRTLRVSLMLIRIVKMLQRFPWSSGKGLNLINRTCKSQTWVRTISSCRRPRNWPRTAKGPTNRCRKLPLPASPMSLGFLATSRTGWSSNPTLTGYGKTTKHLASSIHRIYSNTIQWINNSDSSQCLSNHNSLPIW